MPAGITYSTVATTTLGSAASSYTFSSIPTTYTDLILIAALAPGATNYDFQVGNGSVDTGANYSSTRVFGNGSSAGSDAQSNNTTGVTGNISNSSTIPISTILHFQNYSNTSTNKTVLSRYDVTDSYAFAIVGLWRSTAAINTIRIHSTSAQNIPAGTMLTLYGIASA
jgi:hypothetical protein